MANDSGDKLKDTARDIGSKIGEAHVKARRVVEGVKAAVKASHAAYSAKPKKTAARKKTAKKKSRPSRAN
jgi:hypothetical protein